MLQFLKQCSFFCAFSAFVPFAAAEASVVQSCGFASDSEHPADACAAAEDERFHAERDAVRFAEVCAEAAEHHCFWAVEAFAVRSEQVCRFCRLLEPACAAVETYSAEMVCSVSCRCCLHRLQSRNTAFCLR